MATPRLDPRIQGLIAPEQFQQLAGKDGRLSAKELGANGLLPPPPKGYSYTYQFSNPSAPLQLKQDSSWKKKLGKAAIIAGGIAATAMTGGALAPVLIGAATGAGTGAIDGGWKGALMGGSIGAATGGLAGGAGGAATQTAGQAAKSALLNPQALASIGGQVAPGKAGSMLSMIGGAGGGSMATNTGGWGNLLKTLAKDPNTYSTIGQIAAGAGKGAAAERTGQNNFALDQNRLQQNQYGTQQQALLQLLGLDERATMDRAQLGIAAPQARAKQALLGSLLSRLNKATVTPPAGIRMGKVSGGIGDAIGGDGQKMAGLLLQAQALKALQSGSDVPGPANYAQRGMMAGPQMAGYKGAGGGESLLSALGLMGGMVGGLQGLKQKARTPGIVPQGGG